MDEAKWMTFIRHFWETISYWEIMELYRKYELRGAFFHLNALACRNELLMRLAHTVHLCEVIAEEYEVGNAAEKTLDEIKVVYRKGSTVDRSVRKFDDCGIEPFRNMVLAHPLNQIKAVLGKEQYRISVTWETVEQTLNKIREFADQAEAHNLRLGRLDSSTYKAEIGDVESAFRAVTAAMEDGARYKKLKLDTLMKGGTATVSCDSFKTEIVIVG